jgi:hypothetical protein
MVSIGRAGRSASSHEVFPSLKRRSHLWTVERDRAVPASVIGMNSFPTKSLEPEEFDDKSLLSPIHSPALTS